MYTWIDVHVCTYGYTGGPQGIRGARAQDVYVHIYIHVHIHVPVHTQVDRKASLCMCIICVYMYAFVYTYMYTYTRLCGSRRKCAAQHPYLYVYVQM